MTGPAVLALGLSHHSAPLDLRGRLAFPAERLGPALESLRTRLAGGGTGRAGGAGGVGGAEVALLSTCNRTELYLAGGEDTPALLPPARQWLAEQGASDQAHLAPHLVERSAEDAARHVFRVAAGLDSMVLGEPQILGQIKQAAREASAAGTLGTTLNQLFQRSFAVAKEVRSRTAIGAHSVSMAAACVKLAQQLFGSLQPSKVLLVGAGEMIEVVAAHFASRKPGSITVANRTPERGQALATRIGAATMPLAELPQRLHEFDVVVSCTASSVPIIGLGAVERALRARRRRPMFMVDLAVPRDIELEVSLLGDVYLYTVDDLSSLVQSGTESRQAAVAEAEAIVDSGVARFARWLEQRCHVPLIRAVQDRGEALRQQELERARRALARGDDVAQVMEALSRGLSAKLMHGALAALHDGDDTQRENVADVVQRCFLPPAGGRTSTVH